MGAAPSLDRAFSPYLDLVRFLAALAVVAMHFAQLGIVQAPWAPHLTMLGREAVMAFFVLSGFVIAYTTHQRRPAARDYVAARCARPCSVALPVLLLAFAAAALPHGHDPGDMLDWMLAALAVGVATCAPGMVTERHKDSLRAGLRGLARASPGPAG